MQENVRKHCFRPDFFARGQHFVNFRLRIRRKPVHCNDRGFIVNAGNVFNVLQKVGKPRSERGKIFFRKFVFIGSAVKFKRFDGCDNDYTVGLDTRDPALSVEEFFRA